MDGVEAGEPTRPQPLDVQHVDPRHNLPVRFDGMNGAHGGRVGDAGVGGGVVVGVGDVDKRDQVAVVRVAPLQHLDFALAQGAVAVVQDFDVGAVCGPGRRGWCRRGARPSRDAAGRRPRGRDDALR